MILLINTITVYKTIKMKPIDVADDTYAEYNENFNKMYPKFKVGDHAKISKYKTWNKAKVSVVNIHENNNVNKTLFKLLCISDAKERWGGKNLYDLIDKEIKGKDENKIMNDLTKQQIRKYKIDRVRLIESSKHSMYVHEDILIPIIMQSRLSDSKTIKVRTDLGFNQINLILKKKNNQC